MGPFVNAQISRRAGRQWPTHEKDLSQDISGVPWWGLAFDMCAKFSAESSLRVQGYRFRCPRDARLWSNVFAAEEYCGCVFLAPQCTALGCPWVSALVLPVVSVPSGARGPPDVLFTAHVQQNCSMYCTVTYVVQYEKRADTNHERNSI